MNAEGCIINVFYGFLRFFLYFFLMGPFGYQFSRIFVELCQSLALSDTSLFAYLLSLPYFLCIFMVIFRLRFVRLYLFCSVILLVCGVCQGVLWFIISDVFLWYLFYNYILSTTFQLLLARCCCEIGPRSPRCPAEGGGTTGGEACGGGGQGAGGV